MGPRVFETGPRVFETGPRVFEMGPRVFEMGPRVFEMGPRIFETGPRVFEMGPRIFEMGPRVFEMGPRIFEMEARIFGTGPCVFGVDVSPCVETDLIADCRNKLFFFLAGEGDGGMIQILLNPSFSLNQFLHEIFQTARLFAVGDLPAGFPARALLHALRDRPRPGGPDGDGGRRGDHFA